MSLSNSQYDSIMHAYETRRLLSRRRVEERTKEIYRLIPAYKEIDELVSSVSVAQGKKHLEGNADALPELKDILEDLNRQKKQMLTNAGYSVSYLEPVCQCPYCKDTGYIGNEKCHCFKQAMIDLLYEQSNIHEILKYENFDTLSYEYYFGEDLDHFKKAVLSAHNFVNNFDTDYHNLYFYGTVGTGKSFLSNCVANALLESGHSVIYFSASALFERIADFAFQKSGRESASSPFEDIYGCDLLIIDDLGTESTNSFVLSHFFSCLNERHLRRKATVISTNLSLADLCERYSDRIFSRINSNYELLKLSGQDIRVNKKRMQIRK